MPIIRKINQEDRKSVPEDRLRNFNFGFKGYLYGMRLRGFSPGCQPMQGLVLRCFGARDGYHDVLLYNRKLTEKELRDYEMDFIQEVEVEI